MQDEKESTITMFSRCSYIDCMCRREIFIKQVANATEQAL